MGHDSQGPQPSCTEQRSHARAFGTLHLRYHRAPGGTADVQAWLAGGPPVGEVRAPDSTMNFSPSGIAFDDLPACADGDTLLLDLRIPGDARVWRAAALVQRVSRIPIDERDDDEPATHRVAVSITALSDEAAAALATHTLRTRQAAGLDR